MALLFGVSVASVVKWSQRRRATGSAAARPIGGVNRKRLLAAPGTGDRAVKAMPDITLEALVTELAEQGIPDQPGIGLAAGALEGATLQKTLFAVEQLRPKIARRREQWKKYQDRLDPRRLVFTDET